MEEVKQVAKEFREYQQQQVEKKLKELDTQLEQLKLAKKQAINDSDGETAIQIDDAIEIVKEQQQEAKLESAKKKELEEKKQNTDTEVDPVLQSWLDENSWFGNDRRKTALTNAIGEEIREENPKLIGRAFLDELDKRIEEEFKPTRTRSNPVESGTGSGTNRPRKGSKTYDSLPAEAKAACDRFVAQKLMTKEQYVSEYEWD